MVLRNVCHDFVDLAIDFYDLAWKCYDFGYFGLGFRDFGDFGLHVGDFGQGFCDFVDLVILDRMIMILNRILVLGLPAQDLDHCFSLFFLVFLYIWATILVIILSG